MRTPPRGDDSPALERPDWRQLDRWHRSNLNTGAAARPLDGPSDRGSSFERHYRHTPEVDHVGGWALVAAVFVMYAVAARRLDRLSITAPIVLVVAGTVLGAGYLDVLPANLSTESVRLLTELDARADPLRRRVDRSVTTGRERRRAPTATARNRTPADDRARRRGRSDRGSVDLVARGGV